MPNTAGNAFRAMLYVMTCYVLRSIDAPTVDRFNDARMCFDCGYPGAVALTRLATAGPCRERPAVC